MTYPQKLLEVLIQIALLPVSCFVEICCIPYGIIGGSYLGAIIMQCFYSPKSIRYFDEESKGKEKYVDNGYWKTRNNDVKDSDGNVVGVLEEKVEYISDVTTIIDSGVKYKDFEFFLPMLHAFIALPCRITSLVLSLLALFIPQLYVSARMPKYFKNESNLDANTIKRIKTNPYALIDLIVFE